MQLKTILLILLWFCTASLLRSQESIDEKVKTLIDRVDQLADEDDYTQALKLIEESLVANEAAWTKHPLLKADLLHKQAILYYSMDDVHYKEAVESCQKALDIRTLTLTPTDSLLIHNYYLLTVFLKEDGQYSRAIKSGMEVVRRLNQLNQKSEANYEKMASVCYEVGNLFLRQRNYAASAEYSNQALQLFLALKDEENIIRCYNNLLSALGELGTYQKAKNYFQKIIEHPEASSEDLANAYSNLGFVLMDSGEREKALGSFKESQKINRQLYLDTQDNYYYRNLAGNYENMGICLRHMKDYTAATEATKESMKIMRVISNTRFHPNIAKCHDNMGDILFDEGKYETALESYQRGLGCLIRSFQETNVLINPDLFRVECGDNFTLLTLLNSKARSLNAIYQSDKTKRNYLDAAYDTYLKFDSLLTEIRQGYRMITSTYDLLRRAYGQYEGAIRTMIDLYELTGDIKYFELAYHFAAKHKAVVLLDDLRNEEAKFAELPEDLLQKEQKLKKDYIDIEKEILELTSQAELDQEKLTSLQRARFQLKIAHEELISTFEKKFPAYYRLKYAFSKPIKMATFQEKLPEDGVLLEYFVGEEKLFLFSISRSDFKFFELPKDENFEENCMRFRDMISNFNKKNDAALAYDLFQKTLGQALKDIEEKEGISRLFIIPDDALLQISFDALLTEKVDVWDNKENPYLFKKYSISYAYSNQLLFNDTKRKQLQDQVELFGGFGLEYADSLTLEQLKKLQNDGDTDDRSLGVLANAGDEVSEIADIVGGQYWLNEQVTKQHFLENAPRFKILHWAGHGRIQESNPMNSALIFSLNNMVSDSLLRVLELYDLKLNADMVVLSACNTAYGKLYKGEGMSSLSRAFAYAGCPSIISSLWNASDVATKEILVDFYKNIKRKEPKDKALQQAKLTYLDQNNPVNADPALWSNILVIGDSSPLDLPEDKPTYLFALLGILVGLAIAFFSRRKKKNYA